MKRKNTRRSVAVLLIFAMAFQLMLSSVVFADALTSEQKYNDAQSKVAELEQLLTDCQNKGISPDYEKGDVTLARVFANRIANLNDNNQVTGYKDADSVTAYYQFVTDIYDEIEPKLQSYKSGTSRPVSVNGFAGGTEINENGIQANYSDGETKDASLFGFNMFEAYVNTDSPNWNKTGMHFVSHDGRNFGPSKFLGFKDGGFYVASGSEDTGLVEFRGNMDKFREQKIAVDVCLPMHYTSSSWGLKEAGKYYSDFVPFNPTDPRVFDMIEKYISVVGPEIEAYKDVISTITFQNEPYFEEWDKAFYIEPWHQFLEGKYENIGNLNSVYGTSYADFDDVSMPSHVVTSSAAEKYVINNDVFFLDYKEFQSNILHQYFAKIKTELRKYTDIPVGVKTMQFLRSRLDDDKSPYTLRIMYDYEKFNDIFDFNGTDTFSFIDGESVDNADLRTKLEWFDLISSINGKPVIDSEAHLFDDGENITRNYNAKDWVGANLWMSAMHKADATAVWLYRIQGSASATATQFLNRPYEYRAMSKTALDAARLTKEIGAFKNSNRNVAMLYSFENSAFNDEYLSVLNNTYRVVTANGQTPLFVTENSLDKLNGISVLVVPCANSVKDSTITALQSFKNNGGKIVFVGNDCFTKDENNKTRSNTSAITTLKSGCDNITYSTSYGSNRNGLIATLNSNAYSTIKTAFGNAGIMDIAMEGSNSTDIEWKAVNYNGSTLISAVNYGSNSTTVTFSKNSVTLSGMEDIKNLTTISGSSVVLEPNKPVLLKALDCSDMIQYEPKEFTLTYRGSATKGWNLAWKNPTNETLQYVKVTDANNKVQFIELNGMAGQITTAEVLDGDTTNDSFTEFRLQFAFGDGTEREYIYNGWRLTDTTKQFSQPAGVTFVRDATSTGPHPKASVFFQNKVALGAKSMMIISNKTDESNKGFLLYFDNAGASQTSYQKMQPGTTYKLAMKVKTDTDATFRIISKYGPDNTLATVELTGSDSWQTVEKTFAFNGNPGDNNTARELAFRINKLDSALYIDNIVLTTEDGQTTLVNQNFEGVTEDFAAPTGVTVTAGAGSATFSLPARTGSTRIYNIYEKYPDGTLILCSQAQATTSARTLTLNNLTPGKEYKFIIAGQTLRGLETSIIGATEYTVTPLATPVITADSDMPTCITLSAVKGEDQGFNIAWKNPASKDIKKVTVYTVDTHNVETEVKTIQYPQNNAISKVKATFDTEGGNNYGWLSFRLKFEFMDGTVKDVYQTIYAMHDTAKFISNAQGLCFAHQCTGMSEPPYAKENHYIVNEENATAGGKVALKVVSNRQAKADDSEENGARYAIVFRNSSGTTPYGVLTDGQTYNYSFKVKTLKGATLEVRSGQDMNWHQDLNITGSSDWQTITGTFAPSTIKTWTGGGFIICFDGQSSPVYIDDVVVTDGSGNTVIAQDFEALNVNLAAPSTCGVSTENGEVTFTWDGNDASARTTNIYEYAEDGSKILRARVKPSVKTVTLKETENGKNYGYAISASNFDGLESPLKGIVAPNPAYDYEPTDFTYCFWGTGNNGGFKLAWKNPVKPLDSVTVERVVENNDGEFEVAETLAVNNEANRISWVKAKDGQTTAPSTEAGFYDTFRLVFNFTDGNVREVYYTGYEGASDNGAFLEAGTFGAVNLNFADNQSRASSRALVNAFVQDNVAVSGNALKVVSNRYNSNDYMLWFDGTGYTKMTSGTSYKLSMKVKTDEAAKIYVRTKWNNTDIGNIPVTAGVNWQTVETTFTANTSQALSLTFKDLAAPLYIDNVKLTTADGNTTLVDQNFDSYSPKIGVPTNIKATAGEHSAIFEWQCLDGSATGDAKYYNVYEKKENGTLVLRAKVYRSKGGVTLSNLEGNKEYTFVVTGSSRLGKETEPSKEIKVTPTEKTGFFMGRPAIYDDGEEIECILNQDRTYTADVTVENYEEDDRMVRLIVAAYTLDDNDVKQLIALNMSDVTTVNAGETKTIEIDDFAVDTSNDENMYTFMATVWDWCPMFKPLCEATQYWQ